MPWYYYIVSWMARADNSRLSYYLNCRNTIQNKLSKSFIKSCWVQILYKILRFSYELIYTWRTTNQNTTPRGSTRRYEVLFKIVKLRRFTLLYGKIYKSEPYIFDESTNSLYTYNNNNNNVVIITQPYVTRLVLRSGSCFALI